jgi:type I restriction enzyme S subunit
MGSKVSTSKLVDVADVVDSLHQTPKYSSLGYPMVRCVDLEYGPLNLVNTKSVSEDVYTEYSKRYNPCKGDIIITRVGANFGVTSYVEATGFCLGQNTAAIIPKINPNYLYYILNSAKCRHQMNVLVAGAAQPTLSLKAIKALNIPRLGSETEDKISNIIGNINNKITINNQTNQTLEQMAQALFKSWFVDFDPVFDNLLAKADFKLENLESTSLPEELVKKAKIRLLALNDSTVADKTKASLKALAQGSSPLSSSILPQHTTTHAHFPNEFEHNEQLGWIPKGWLDGTFENIADALSGYAFKGKDFSEVGCAVIKIKNISADRSVGIFDVNRVSKEIGASASRFLLNDGDIVMAMTGATVGKFGVLSSESNEPYYLNQRVCKLSPKIKNGSPFLFAALNKPSIEESIVNAAQGSAQPNISANGILATKLLVPSLDSIELFNMLLMDAFDRKVTLRKECYTLTKLRDTLLPKLISGELQIPDVETPDEKIA